MSQRTLPLQFPAGPALPREKRGAVFTRPWVVDLVLGLAGYVEATNLVDVLAVEPAAGDGAFLVAMVRRLIGSCRRQGRPVADCAGSLLAYELDDISAEAARMTVADTLAEMSISHRDANELSCGWVRTGDYLLEAGRLPHAAFVVGNPPYVRLEDMSPEVVALYRATYPTMRGRADLYVGFFEAALNQIQPGGVCAFICADRWMLNQYGAELRGLVTSGFEVRAVVEMHNASAFDSDVSAYPAITVISRGPQGRAIVASASADAEKAGTVAILEALVAAQRGEPAACPGISAAAVESWFSGSSPWPCGSPERLALLKDLEARFPTLESDVTGTRVGIGVATGLDEVYITADAGLVEPGRLVPLALPSDIRGGTLEWSGRYLVNPWETGGLVELEDYPRLRDYFHRHAGRLRERNTARRNPHAWFRTIDRVNLDLTGLRKLYLPDIKGRIHPVLDEGETYPHHNLYWVTSDGWDLEVLGALLMSDVGQFFVESYGVRMRGGYLRFQAQYLRRIRVPRPTDVFPDQARQLVNAFRDRDSTAATRVAFELYGIDAIPAEARHGS
jgi:adenine-specific DNA-methyltransferase